MELYALIGKSLHGKNRVREALTKISKNTWEILEEKDKVLFSSEPGPWVKIRPVDVDSQIADSLVRWVHLINDDDFSLNLEG